MTTFSLEADRRERIGQLTGSTLDVLVVGGGIVGAGVARDAAMRGLRVGLVEQSDFASGTSSRTSRLLHGGIRYLAQGRVGLVWEASHEKRLLQQIAPHLADPLAFLFPTYKGEPWPRWQLAVGVRIYDLLCGGRNFAPSESYRTSGMLERLSQLNPEGLTGGVRYYDALTNDARMVLDTLSSAERAGATVCNYLKLQDAEPGKSGWRCKLADRLDAREYEASAHLVVNATGPWSANLPHSSIRLRLTKGVHLVVDRQRLPVPDAVVMTRGNRILFAIPWGERVILGTTDTDYDAEIEAVHTDAGDIDYVLSVVNDSFPTAKLDGSDVIATWAGLRPLLASKRGGPSDISRSHCIASPQPGWIDVAGGKLTTYRLIAQQTVDLAAKQLARDLPRCRTAAEPLLTDGGTENFSGILPPAPSRDVVEHLCRHQWAVHLDDVMLRRTSWQFYCKDREMIAGQVAGWMAEIFGWDDARRTAELTSWQKVRM